MPDWPALPSIRPDALECLSEAAYTELVRRDAMLQAHARRLEAIIRTTH